MDRIEALSAFSALGQETRLDVFRLLLNAGQDGLVAGELCALLHIRANTMSANLTVLHNAGLVSKRREGRSIRYFADIDGLRGLLVYLLQDCCGGRPDLCSSLIEDIAVKSCSTPQNKEPEHV